jgi:Tfp pilus assembly protein PilN
MYKVNLLPSEMITEKCRKGVSGLEAATFWRVAAAVLVLSYGFFVFNLFSAKSLLAERQRVLDGISDQVAAAEALRQEREQAEATVAAWRGVLLGREDWVSLLREVNAVLPEEVWFTALDIRAVAEKDPETPLPPRPDTVYIEGSSRSLTAVGVLVHELHMLPQLAGVTLEEVREGRDGVLSFRISVELARSGKHVAAVE